MTPQLSLLAVAFLSLAPYISCQALTSDKTLVQALGDIPECASFRNFLLQFPEVQSPPPGNSYIVFCPINEAVERKLAAPKGAAKVKRDTTDMKLSLGLLTATRISVTKKISTASSTSAASSTSTASSGISTASNGTSTALNRKRQVTSVVTSLFTVVHSSSTGPVATNTPVATVTPAATTTSSAVSSPAAATTSSAVSSPATAITSSAVSSPAATTTSRAVSSPAASSFIATAAATGFRTSGPDPLTSDPDQLSLKTTFKDPAYVNLGPGEFQSIVSFGASAFFANTNLKIVAGLGNITNTLRANIPFNLGIIHVIDELITVPKPLSPTLTSLGQSIFLAALTKFNLISDFENTPRITAFVPIDSSLPSEPSECTCKQHIVEGPPLYTPEFELGKSYTTRAGGNITIEVKNGEYTLPGGATIVKANVITKNGVVHFIKGTISGGCEIKPFTSMSSKKEVWMGGLVGLVGVLVGLLA